MTDRIKGYVVTMEENIREDDARVITDAIRLLKGVLSVQPVQGDVNDLMHQERVRMALLRKIQDMILGRI